MVAIQFSISLLAIALGYLVLLVLGLLLLLGTILASDSIRDGLKNLGLFLTGFIAWVLSKVAVLVRTIGFFSRISAVYTALFNLYPGQWFAEKVREDFVTESLKYIDQGVVELEEERNRDELIDYLGLTHSYSGRTISDGEATLALILVAVGIFSFGPSWLLPVITVILALTVSIRLVSLDALLYEIPETEEDINRLELLLAWNEGVVNRPVFDAIVILRVFHDFDERLYWVYLRRILWQNYVHGSVSKIDMVNLFQKQFTVIIESKIWDVNAEELSRERYGRNVLTFHKPPSISKQTDTESNRDL